jgi:hypothetical protein
MTTVIPWRWQLSLCKPLYNALGWRRLFHHLHWRWRQQFIFILIVVWKSQIIQRLKIINITFNTVVLRVIAQCRWLLTFRCRDREDPIYELSQPNTDSKVNTTTGPHVPRIPRVWLGHGSPSNWSYRFQAKVRNKRPHPDRYLAQPRTFILKMWGSILGENGVYSSRPRVQTVSGAHPSLLSHGYKRLLTQRLMKPGRNANRSLPSSAEV